MKAVVTGAGGMIGFHLVRRLKQEGYYVVGLDRKDPEFEKSSADEFVKVDLRYIKSGDSLFAGADEVYNLAAQMGGIGFLTPDRDAEVMRDSNMINLSVLEVCRQQQIPKIFFSSSACVYPDGPCDEEKAYPAMPELEYGFEKLWAERLYLAYARNFGLNVRVGRYHNIYATHCTYDGGREKAPAALCRKVAEAKPGDTLRIWGTGQQLRSFTWIGDCLEGTIRLMRSDFEGPVNIGSAECVTIDYLAQVIMMHAEKQLHIEHIPGPVGVSGRNSSNTLILDKLGWAPRTPLHVGMEKLYAWVKEQIDAKQKAA